MKIIFMGTPDFAVPALRALHDAGHEIQAVVSQPDRPKGRHGELSPTPVKEEALRLSLPVLQPEKAKDESFIEQIRELSPELIVVAAYGQILKKALLEIPKYGCINIHASLLPRWRGAAPIQWAVIEGDEKSGVTAMQMNEGLDTGDMLLKREITIDRKETSGTLFDKLSRLGGELIVETVDKLQRGELKPEKQDDSLTTYASMLDKSMGRIRWNRKAVEIERLIRGLDPWPSAYTLLNKKMLKLWNADVISRQEMMLITDMQGDIFRSLEDLEPGTVVISEKSLLIVKTGEDYLKINELQPEGKKRMSTEDYLRGNKLEPGTVFA